MLQILKKIDLKKAKKTLLFAVVAYELFTIAIEKIDAVNKGTYNPLNDIADD